METPQISPELVKIVRKLERSSKTCLRDSIACIQQAVPPHALAVLFHEARRRAEAYGAQEPSETAPPELARIYRQAVGRYEQAALNLYGYWQDQVISLVKDRYEQLDADLTLHDRTNAEHAAKAATGAVGTTAEAEWLVSRVAHAKLTLDNVGHEEPPLTSGERMQIVKTIKVEIDADRERRERWADADVHPHLILLSEMLCEVMQALLDRVAAPQPN